MSYPAGYARVPGHRAASDAWPRQSWSAPMMPVQAAAPVAAPPRTPWPFAKAFACAGAVYGVATVLLLIVLLRQVPSGATAYQLGYVTGRGLSFFLIAAVVPALVTGLVVRLSPRVWPLWQVALVFLPMFFVVAAIQVAATAAR